jgi:hypothetical protein
MILNGNLETTIRSPMTRKDKIIVASLSLGTFVGMSLGFYDVTEYFVITLGCALLGVLIGFIISIILEEGEHGILYDLRRVWKAWPCAHQWMRSRLYQRIRLPGMLHRVHLVASGRTKV